ncbi:hypothetical protein SAMN05421833_10955 [Microbispora rosea]|uniref:Uncharacterized protein n=1 Tax=Microbispora rosea TaxID=58117 RepID=A0A1N7AYW1_9ACTN|nr:hypothetical protein SAMN05421833_10955 [Microbispora rosea]
MKAGESAVAVGRRIHRGLGECLTDAARRAWIQVDASQGGGGAHSGAMGDDSGPRGDCELASNLRGWGENAARRRLGHAQQGHDLSDTTWGAGRTPGAERGRHAAPVRRRRCGVPPAPTRPRLAGGPTGSPVAMDRRPALSSRWGRAAIGGDPHLEKGVERASGCAPASCHTVTGACPVRPPRPRTGRASVFPGDVTEAGSVGSIGYVQELPLIRSGGDPPRVTTVARNAHPRADRAGSRCDRPAGGEGV